MVQDASGTLKVYVNDPENTISSTNFPTEVYLAGEFDTSTSTVNNLKYNGAKFSVSSAGTDASGNKFLNLKSDSTSAINITDTKIKVLHTASKDVDAYFEGGTDIFDNQTVEKSKIKSSLDIALKENPHVMIWIIEVDNEIAGYFALAIGFTIEAGGKDGFLDELFLKEKYRDKGIGRAAVKFALDICPSMGIRRLSLEVETHNLRAKRLYQDIGFFTHDRILMSYWLD